MNIPIRMLNQVDEFLPRKAPGAGVHSANRSHHVHTCTGWYDLRHQVLAAIDMNVQDVCESRFTPSAETGDKLWIHGLGVDSRIRFREFIACLAGLDLTSFDAVLVPRPFVPYSWIPMLKDELVRERILRRRDIETLYEGLHFFFIDRPALHDRSVIKNVRIMTALSETLVDEVPS